MFTHEPPGELPSFIDRPTTEPIKLDISSMFVYYDIERSLEELDENKAIGPDNIHPRVLKNCAAAIAKPLELIFRRSVLEDQAPELFKQANVKPSSRAVINKMQLTTDRSLSPRSYVR